MKKNKNNKKPDEEPEEKPDFSFADVSSEIDKIIEKKTGAYDPTKEFKIEHVSDKIRFAKTIKEQPPLKDFMNVEFKEAEITSTDKDGIETKEKGVAVITEHEGEPEEEKKRKIAIYDGIFNIDLNTDAYFWFVRSCNVFPLILDQGIRTHLDVKRSHEPEKRRTEIPIYLIGLAITGVIMIFLLFHFLTRGG